MMAKTQTIRIEASNARGFINIDKKDFELGKEKYVLWEPESKPEIVKIERLSGFTVIDKDKYNPKKHKLYTATPIVTKNFERSSMSAIRLQENKPTSIILVVNIHYTTTR